MSSVSMLSRGVSDLACCRVEIAEVGAEPFTQNLELTPGLKHLAKGMVPNGPIGVCGTLIVELAVEIAAKR